MGLFTAQKALKFKVIMSSQWRTFSKNGNTVPSGLASCVIARWIGIYQGIKNMESLTGDLRPCVELRVPQDFKQLCGLLEHDFRGEFTRVPLLQGPT